MLALALAMALGLVARPVVAGEMGQAATPTPVATNQGTRSSTFALSFHATVRELRLNTTSNTSVTLPGLPGENALQDACHLQSGTTYEQVDITLEITETDATLTCHGLTATAGSAGEGAFTGSAAEIGMEAADEVPVETVETDQIYAETNPPTPSLTSDDPSL